MVRQFEDDLREGGRSTAMIRRAMVSLGSILAGAQERGHVARNVVRDLGRRRRGQDRTEQRHKRKLEVGVDIPAPDEIRVFVGNLLGRWRPLLLTAIFAGLRVSELRGLRWRDVDLKKGEIHVRQRADEDNKIGDTKSSAAQRTVPIPPIVVEALHQWRKVCPEGDDGLVFPNARR